MENQSFCLKGKWKKWGEMSQKEKAKKIAIKIQIAESCKDEVMENFWKSVTLSS